MVVVIVGRRTAASCMIYSFGVDGLVIGMDVYNGLQNSHSHAPVGGSLMPAHFLHWRKTEKPLLSYNIKCNIIK